MRMLLLSSSNVHGSGYLDHAVGELRRLGLKRVAFVPFALADRPAYTARVRERLSGIGIDVVEVTSSADLDGADGVFVGGGNTFRLLATLSATDLLDAIRTGVRDERLSYIGSSAGTNIAAPTIRTTNDMPIVQPRSFQALGLVPFQINPHYLDADPLSTHKGETREERLLQYLEENATPVIGLREPGMLRIEGGRTTLVGPTSARWFSRGAEPRELEPGTVIEEVLAER